MQVNRSQADRWAVSVREIVLCERLPESCAGRLNERDRPRLINAKSDVHKVPRQHICASSFPLQVSLGCDAVMSAPPCMYFQATRDCIYGNSCPFSHDIQPAASKRDKEPSPVSDHTYNISAPSYASLAGRFAKERVSSTSPGLHCLYCMSRELTCLLRVRTRKRHRQNLCRLNNSSPQALVAHVCGAHS